MVEAVVVISVFVTFFLGMVYFRSLYEQKLRVQQLGRAGVVAFAMKGCPSGGDPMASIKADLGAVQDNSGSPSGGSSGDPSKKVQVPSTSVGQNSKGDPVAGAVGKSGFAGDPISVFNLQAPASGTSKSSPITSVGFNSTVHTTAAMSCGDKQEAGNVKDAIQYIGNLFQL